MRGVLSFDLTRSWVDRSGLSNVESQSYLSLLSATYAEEAHAVLPITLTPEIEIEIEIEWQWKEGFPDEMQSDEWEDVAS